MGQRAQQQQETRRRIVEAAVGLHATVGPARTTITEIAVRAGVQRVTVYRHFPDEESLFRACIGYGLELDPPPDWAALSRVAEPQERLRSGLDQVYAYYKRNRDVIGNSLRDMELVPALRAPAAVWMEPLGRLGQVLMEGWPEEGRQTRSAAIRLALDFSTWRTVVVEMGLSRTTAVELMVRLVRCAADGDAT